MFASQSVRVHTCHVLLAKLHTRQEFYAYLATLDNENENNSDIVVGLENSYGIWIQDPDY